MPTTRACWPSCESTGAASPWPRSRWPTSTGWTARYGPRCWPISITCLLSTWQARMRASCTNWTGSPRTTSPPTTKRTRKEALPMRETTLQKHQSRDERKAEMLTKEEAPLVEIDWRILYWLSRYPLQRADDLVVGEARWASRATVYRHLQG